MRRLPALLRKDLFLKNWAGNQQQLNLEAKKREWIEALLVAGLMEVTALKSLGRGRNPGPFLIRTL